jgi:sensor histidine kinase YesM
MSIIRKKRVEIIGFNDFWFIVIGTVILSLITDFLFNDSSFLQYSFGYALINWSISWLFSICNWMIMREIMIYLRRRLPAFSDNLKRIVILFVLIIITIIVIDRVGAYTLGQVFGQDYSHPSTTKLLVPILLISVMILAIYEAIHYYSRLQEFVRKGEQAKQVIIEAQLDALRNQARPHFLFNSFNTLRDIIYNDPKDNAINFVDRLSEVYRYILESGNVNLISLSEEIQFSKSYIHIQSERFGNNLRIEWNIDSSIEDTMVIPMSLQLLLENAIKHNVVSSSKPLTISISAEDNHLVVKNNIQLKSTQLPSTKIGLANIQKRYALISERPLVISNDDREFIVKLPLLQVNYN